MSKQQFRGTWAHADLFPAVKNHVLTTEQAWMALIIDSFVKSGSGKDGCFASELTLAEETGKSVRQVERDLKILQGYRKSEDGKWRKAAPAFIRKIGHRVICGKKLNVYETMWSRVYAEDPLYDICVETPCTTSVSETPCTTSTTHNRKQKIQEEKKENVATASLADARSSGDGAHVQRIRFESTKDISGNGCVDHVSNGHNGFKLNGKDESSSNKTPAHTLTMYLYDEIKGKKPQFLDRRTNLAKWDKAFAQLLSEHSVSEIKGILEFHCAHMGEGYMPEAYCGDKFCEKYHQIIRAKERFEQKQARPNKPHEEFM